MASDDTDSKAIDGESKIVTASDEEVARFAGPSPRPENDKGQEPGPRDEDESTRLCRERDEFKDKYLRAQAECANTSRRLHQQHAKSLKLAGMGLARALLPVVDNFHRTLDSLGASESDDPILEGVRLIAEEFDKTLRDHGVVPIEATGHVFDPVLHEALMQDFETDAPAGTVSQELERGYKMNDHVLRPAKVAVAARKPEADSDSESDSESSRPEAKE